MAQTHIYLRFTWQACHSWHWVAPLGPGFGAGAPRHFAWQAWHNLTSTFVSRGRRGTISHLPSFCVAGVPLMVLGGALGPGFWRRGAAPLCVAGVAQPDIHLRFTWQAWHKLTSTVVLRGRRATYGTGWRPWAGIWRRGAAPHFAWQAWHNLTSTFVSRGRRGTNSHLLSFCVAGEPLMVLGGALGPGFGAGAPRHFAWQAWHNLTSTFVFTWQAWHNLTSTVVLRGRRATYGTGWRPWAGIWRRGAAPLCVAGVAQPDIHLRFTWQAWHKLTSTVVFAWQACHLWYWVAPIGPGFGAWDF